MVNIRWFEEYARIRPKPSVTFGLRWGLTAAMSVALVLSGGSAVSGAVVTVISGIASIAFSEAIAGARVAAAESIKLPAAGDAASNTGFSGSTGCAGHASARNRPVASNGCPVRRELVSEGDT